jgi:hypothetical protein
MEHLLNEKVEYVEKSPDKYKRHSMKGPENLSSGPNIYAAALNQYKKASTPSGRKPYKAEVNLDSAPRSARRSNS